jgi:diadenosine tetraphosphate (Ap4A) HIT family hydrolase
VILVPQRDNVREVFELSDADQHQLMIESNAVAKAMADHFKAEKMNVAALGNMVPQLHIHHIARFSNDVAWPKPVWGLHPPMAYGEAELAERLSVLKRVLCG